MKIFPISVITENLLFILSIFECKVSESGTNKSVIPFIIELPKFCKVDNKSDKKSITSS